MGKRIQSIPNQPFYGFETLVGTLRIGRESVLGDLARRRSSCQVVQGGARSSTTA